MERDAIRKEFERGASLPLILFPKDGTEISNSPRLTLIIGDPYLPYTEGLHPQLARWTKDRTRTDPRLYPGALIWCLKKEGRELREKVELALSWRRVKDEIENGSLGGEFEPSERQEVTGNVREAEEEVKEEVWAGYRFVVIYDQQRADGLHVIDLGAGHASAGQTLTARIIAAMKSEAYLNENVGGGYIERNWPEALRASGAWSLVGLRKSFLDGSLTRLPDPDAALKTSIPRLVERGEFGLASGLKTDGTFRRIWISELVPSEEVTFDSETFLLLKERVMALRTPESRVGLPASGSSEAGLSADIRRAPGETESAGVDEPEVRIGSSESDERIKASFELRGLVPPEVWNKLGIGLVPTLKRGQALSILLTISVKIAVSERENFERELRRRLAELGLASRWTVQVQETQD